LSETIKKRIFSVEVPPELKNYGRLAETESQINEVWQLPETEFLRRLKITDYRNKDFIRAETLACLLNFAHSENLAEIERLIYERLFIVCKNYVRKMGRDKKIVDEDFIEELARDVFAEVYRQVIERRQKCYDYWEVRFYQPLKFIAQSHLQKHATEYDATELFSEKSGENEMPFEETLETNENFARDLEIRETNRKILAPMTEDLRKIFIFHYRDGETQKKIAEYLGISDRSVRYKLAEIAKFLDQWRNSQGEAK